MFADDLVRRNVFTEPYALPLFPMKDISPYHPGLEVGYVRDGRSGGEYWSGAAMVPWLKKERERGRIALPNVECTVTDDAQLVACLRAAYAYGVRFTTLYNWHMRTNTAALLKEFADSIDIPPGIGWQPGSDDAGRNGPGSYAREFAAGPAAFGVNRVELFPFPGTNLTDGMRVTIRDIEPGELETTTVAFTPPSPARDNGPVVVLLPTMFRQEPGHRYELSVETGRPGVLRLSPDRMVAARLTADIILERARSLRIEDWQDAGDIIASVRERGEQQTANHYAQEALEDADRLLNLGRPREAYHAAVRCEQLLLPSSFDLPLPGGQLSPYPVTVRCPEGSVRAVIRTFDDHSAIVSIRSAVAQRVSVRLGDSGKTAEVPPGESMDFSLTAPGR